MTWRSGPDTATTASTIRWPAFLAAAAVLAAGCREEGGGGGLPVVERGDLEAELGFARVVKPHAWNLLRVRVRNRGEDFRGKLEARVGDDSDELAYGAAVEVPGRLGGLREVQIPVFVEDAHPKVTVDLTARGFGRRFSVEGHDTGEHDARLLVVGSSRQDFTNLTAAAALKRLRTATAAPEDLSSSPFAYEPFSLIVLAGTSLATAPAGAAEALGRWVERGGTLVAFPGVEWASGLPDATRDLLGVTLGSAERSLPPELAAALGPLAAAAIYRDLRPGASTVDAPGGLACIAARGAGRVFTFRVAPEGDFPGPDRAPALHDVLWYAVARSLSFAGDPAAGLARLEGSLQEFLQEMTGFMPPARGAVFLALLVYLFAGFLLPYHLLARRGRREWSYAVVVVAAVVATVAIYRYGVLSAMNDAEAEEVTVLRLHRDGSAAEATSFIAAISPRYTQLDPGEGFLGDEEGAAREPRPRALVPGNRAIPRGAGPVEMDARGGLRHPPVTLYPNEARFFRYDYQVPVSRLATVEYVRDEDLQQDQIRFTNRTRSASVVYQQSLFGEFQVDRRLDPAVSDTIAPQRARPVRPPYRLLDPRWSEDQSDAEHNVRTRLRQSNQDTIAGKASEVVFASLHRQDARLAGGARPRYFAASFSEGVFPGLQSFRRKAVTVLFVEIPPAGFH